MEEVGLTTALRRSFHTGLRGVVPYCLPFLIVGFGSRAMTVIVDRYSGHSAAWIDLLLLFLVCYPQFYLAEILVAHTYLHEESPATASLSSEGMRRLFRSDVALLIARVVVRCVAWLLAMMGFLIVEYLIIEIAMHLVHWGTPWHIGKTLNHVMVEVAFVFYAGLCSRYSFVFPLYAFREPWHSDALVDGVRLAKGQWRMLWGLAMAASVVVFVSYDLSKWGLMALQGSRLLDRSVQVIRLILAALITGYFTVLKTELMRRSSLTSQDGQAR